MARPNTLTFKSSGDNALIQMISNVEFTTIADIVLEKFAASDGAGDLFLSAGANGNYTSIGTHTDNRTENVGSSDITITSNTITFYQNLVANNIGSVTHKPVTWDYTSESIRIFTDNDLNDFADDIINHMVINEAAGSYRIANSSPASTHGGTWATVATLLNQVDKDNSAAAFLYKKLTDSSALKCRPLKYTSDNCLQLMSDNQISELANVVRSRIVENDIGKYLLQTTAPTPGTWVNVGTLTDTRRTTSGSGPSYAGPASYTGPAVAYTGPATYVGIASFSGTAGYSSSATFFGPAQFTGVVSTQFAGFVPTQFTGTSTYTGGRLVSFYGTAQFAGAVAVNYTGEANFVGGGGTFAGPATYSGPASFTGTAGFVGTAYYISQSPFFQPGQAGGGPQYTGPTVSSQEVQFISPWAEPDSYIGQASYFGPSGTFTGSGTFSGPDPANFYTGTVLFYGTAQFTGPVVVYYGPVSFASSTTFYGPALFYGFFPWAGTAQFTGASVNYTGPATFTGVTSAFFTGVGVYSRFVDQNFTSSAQFSGVTVVYYTGTTTAQFTGTAGFTGGGTFFGPASFSGPAGFSGTGQFSSTTFAGEASYIGGPDSAVGSALVTVGQTTLWRRIG